MLRLHAFCGHHLKRPFPEHVRFKHGKFHVLAPTTSLEPTSLGQSPPQVDCGRHAWCCGSSTKIYGDQNCKSSVRAAAPAALQVLQRLGLVDALMPFKEPGDGFHISRHNFKPLVAAIDQPVRALLAFAAELT